MNAHEIKGLLIRNLENVVIFLLPEAKRHGNYFHIGSVNGEAGNSLKICITGAKAGVWMDGADSGKGDILDLWAAVRGVNSYREILPEVKEYLGVTTHLPTKKELKKYKTPKREWSKEPNDQLTEALQDRGISEEVFSMHGVFAHSERKNVMCFPYCDEDGKTRMVKFIKPATIGVKKKVWCAADGKPILYGMHLKTESRSVVITEGEIDALSFAEQGIFAVSVPFGAKGDDENGHSPNEEWIRNCYEWLEAFETVYLCMDNDEAGAEATASLIPRLGRERTKVIDLGEYNDANEAHQAGAQLTEYMEQAKTRDPDDLCVGSAMMDKVWREMRKGPRETQGIIPFHWEFPEDKEFRIRPREGTIVTGFSEGGKSNFVYQLFAWLAVFYEQNCFIGSYEESATEILKIAATHILGRKIAKDEFKEFKKIEEPLSRLVMHEYEGTIKYKDFFDYAHYAVKRYGCSQVLLDGVSCTDVDLDDKKSVEMFAKDAQKFWKETNSHLWIIAHSRKAFDESKPPGKLDVKGSGYLTDLAFNCITIYRPPEEEDTGYDSKMIVNKQKVGGKRPELELSYDDECYRLFQHYENEKGSWV